METILEQFFELLITPPGNLIYHLVLIFSITAAFQALLVNRQERGNPVLRQLVILFSLLLLCQITLLFSVGFSWQGLLVSDKILPPLDRAISMFSLLWIAYLWCYPLPSKPVIITGIIVSMAMVVFSAYSFLTWDITIPYNLTWFNQIWSISTILVLLTGMVILSLKRPENWIIGQVFLVINLAATLSHLLWYLPHENYASVIRLGHLCSFPLLPSLAHRLRSGLAYKTSRDASFSVDTARKKIDANKKTISSLTHELEDAQNQIIKLQNEKEESRIKFQQLSQDILFLSSQININEPEALGPDTRLEGPPDDENKGDKVLRVWIEQIQKDNDELNQENKQLLQKNLSLTAKIKQFQWDQEIDTEELDALQIENENIDHLLDELSEEIQNIGTLLNTHSQNYVETKNIEHTSKQHIQSLKEIIDAIHQFLDPQAEMSPLTTEISTSTDVPKNNDVDDNTQDPVETYEAELELLLGSDENLSSLTKENIENEAELGLPQFMQEVPHREKTQPIRIKKSNGKEADTSSTISENFLYRHKEFNDSEYRKQLNEQLKRLRIQKVEHKNQRVGEIVPHLTPLFTKALQALNILTAATQEAETSSQHQAEITSDIRQRMEHIETKQTELNHLIQDSVADLTSAKQISSELKFKNQQLRTSIEKAKEAQLRAEEIADEQLNENSDLRTAKEKYEKQVNDLKSKLDEISSRQEKTEEDLLHVETNLQQISKEKEDISNQLKTTVADIKGAPIEVKRLKENLSEYSQKIENLIEETERTKQENAENNKKMAEMINELMQPANSIQGYTDLLLSETVGKLGAAHLKFAELIRSSAQHLSDLLNEMNKNMKEKGDDVTHPATNIQAVIDQALENIDQIKREKNIDIQSTTPDGADNIIIEKDLFKQVVIQILENACSHSPENGTVDLKVSLESGEDATDIISIQVADQGELYSDEQIENLFQSQDDDIGLSVAKTLVESQGGTIRAENQEDTGSVISVTLPL